MFTSSISQILWWIKWWYPTDTHLHELPPLKDGTFGSDLRPGPLKRAHWLEPLSRLLWWLSTLTTMDPRHQLEGFLNPTNNNEYWRCTALGLRVEPRLKSSRKDGFLRYDNQIYRWQFAEGLQLKGIWDSPKRSSNNPAGITWYAVGIYWVLGHIASGHPERESWHIFSNS